MQMNTKQILSTLSSDQTRMSFKNVIKQTMHTANPLD